ncbi:MFS transporter [Nocardioides currus]|uniref:MFS transporter n=1 Tax=Nocardioides currus TaxID=2133958 RepID=A0A2R7YUS2_9ACTN|nr:MFS transporter [Nocardioides currus]PUA79816.1 MFS transporter [Nocardioides currus]
MTSRGSERIEASDFRLRDIAVAAYGPTVVNAIGHGAVLPILALRARELGADVSVAALVVAALGLGSLVASLPAGALIARIGERRALTTVGSLDAVAMAFAALTDSVLALGLAVVLSGMTWTVFLMARQGFMIDAVPLEMRARAMSGLGASMRVGVLIGPLLGAALIHLGGLTWVFWLASVMSLCSALLARSMPDFGSEARATTTTHLSVWSVLVEHRRTLLTLGVAVVIIAASRSLRIGLLPLWAEHVGLSASTTSLIFAVAAAVDIAFSFPGGWLMDNYGRFVVAVPVVATTAVGCLVLPLATSAAGVAAVMALMAVGNGLGAGIVMTIGADTAPVEGRAQFLGGWRLCGDIGGSGGALVVGAVAAAAPLAAACLTMGALAAVGTVWVGFHTRRLDVRSGRPGGRLSRR